MFLSDYSQMTYRAAEGSVDAKKKKDCEIHFVIENYFVFLQVSAHNAKKKIVETSQNCIDFLQKYDELKSKK